MTVAWSLPPKRLPISGKDSDVISLQRYIATCLASVIGFALSAETCVAAQHTGRLVGLARYGVASRDDERIASALTMGSVIRKLPPGSAEQQELYQQLVDGLKPMGLEMLVAPQSRLPMLNAVKIPEGVDEAAVRKTLLDDHDIEIGAGLGPLAGKIWRIGLMGHTARPQSVDRLLEALSSMLPS